jgi:hypothetical protein
MKQTTIGEFVLMLKNGRLIVSDDKTGRLEGHADIAARLRAILDPEHENHWNIDGLLEAVGDNAKMLEAMRKELNALCNWGDESFMHAYAHIGNVIKNLRADVRTEKILREKAEARLADLTDDFHRVMDEDCNTDEGHCACVPHLRRRIAELEALAT